MSPEHLGEEPQALQGKMRGPGHPDRQAAEALLHLGQLHLRAMPSAAASSLQPATD